MLSAIYLDMDGVLVDFAGGALLAHDVEPDRVSEIQAYWSVNEPCGTSKAEFKEWLHNAPPEFWEDLGWTDYGQNVYEMCSEFAPVVLMTSPSGPNSACGKLKWIAKNLPNHGRFAITSCKHHMAHPGALLVDDHAENVNNFRGNGGKAFLWPAFWNSAGRMPQDYDLEDLEVLLKSLSE